MSTTSKSTKTSKTVIEDMPAQEKVLTDAEKKQLKGGLTFAGGLGETDCANDTKTTGHTSCDVANKLA